ncbi:NAD(P)-dependent oxidoreductase [Thioclava nitratireducens]|uniref:NAD(P)-dependent oxidoreductase n=1 Tax=Thioclava nitratireducens TaxID=1915078 RepID=UPI000989CDD0|nr:NAD(P)-dependent oxidoreductase [Thioclava nitratireducens]
MSDDAKPTPSILALIELKPADMMEAFCAAHPVTRDATAREGIEIVLTSGARGLSGEEIAEFRDLRLIAVNGVGTDAVDLDAAAARGIHVTTTPDVLSEAVAELALGLAISVRRRIGEGERLLRSGGWSNGQKPRLGQALTGCRAGILGYGRIGRALADMLRALGVDVIYHARKPHDDAPEAWRPDARTLAAESDVLFVTLSATPETRYIVDAPVLEALGSEGTLVNVARGSVVDSAALAAALHGGTLGSAALDVFEVEPVAPDGAEDGLLRAPNTLFTPHIASATNEARRAMAQLVIANIDAYLAGAPLLSPVGPA